LEEKNIGTASEEIDIFPSGTAFSISPLHVLSAYHNVGSNGNFNRMCLVKALTASVKVLNTDIINLKATPVYFNENDDWIILERETGTFNEFAEICELEAELPQENSDISIKHFPVGLISSSSVAELRVVSANEKIIFFAQLLLCAPVLSTKKKSKIEDNMKFSVTKNPTDIVTLIKDIAFVTNGLSKGSCGAPYFSINNKVFAFHVESVDDAVNDNLKSKSSATSHQSYCNGYVLCRLDSFMKAYAKVIKPINTGNMII
jgi:hypothetical protein